MARDPGKTMASKTILMYSILNIAWANTEAGGHRGLPRQQFARSDTEVRLTDCVYLRLMGEKILSCD